MKKIILATIVIIFFVHCGNDKSATYNKETIDSLFTALLTPAQHFSVFCDRDTTLTTRYGSKIIIPKGSLCYENNDSIFEKVEIELREFYKISNMVLGNLSTLSENRILETDGMIYLNATSNGEKVKIKEGREVTLEMPTKKVKHGMKLFHGNKTEDGNVNWNEAPNSMKDSSPYNSDTTKYSVNPELYNSFQILKFDWINCDKFLQFENTGDLFVEIDNADDIGPVFCSIILKQHNSIIPSMIADGKKKFSPVPFDEEATVLCMGYKDNNYYLGMSDIIIQKNQLCKLKLFAVSKDELMEKLSSLDSNRSLAMF